MPCLKRVLAGKIIFYSDTILGCLTHVRVSDIGTRHSAAVSTLRPSFMTCPVTIPLPSSSKNETLQKFGTLILYYSCQPYTNSNLFPSIFSLFRVYNYLLMCHPSDVFWSIPPPCHPFWVFPLSTAMFFSCMLSIFSGPHCHCLTKDLCLRNFTSEFSSDTTMIWSTMCWSTSSQNLMFKGYSTHIHTLLSTTAFPLTSRLCPISSSFFHCLGCQTLLVLDHSLQFQALSLIIFLLQPC